MSSNRPRQRSGVVATVGVTALAASIVTAVAPVPAFAAPLSGTLTVTTPTNAKVAAGVAKQVIVLTVSGTGAPTLSEDTVASVDLSASDTNCQTLTNYVITSPTTLTIKTPSGTSGSGQNIVNWYGCNTTTPGLEDVKITFTSGDTLTKTNALTYVAPPAITTCTATAKPATTENSAGLTLANRITRVIAAGGQTVRVSGGAAFAFDPRTAAGLKVNLGGKDATDVKVYSSGPQGGLTAGTQMTATNTTDAQVVGTGQTPATELGNYLTFKTVTGMDPTNDTLVIGQNGVSKSFLATTQANCAAGNTSLDVVAGPTVTTVSPNSGPSKGGTSVTITATGLTKTWVAGTDYDVFFCGTAATSANDTINAAGTAITTTTPDVTAVAAISGNSYAGLCPVQIKTIVNSTPNYTSPVNAASYFAFLSE